MVGNINCVNTWSDWDEPLPLGILQSCDQNVNIIRPKPNNLYYKFNIYIYIYIYMVQERSMVEIVNCMNVWLHEIHFQTYPNFLLPWNSTFMSWACHESLDQYQTIHIAHLINVLHYLNRLIVINGRDYKLHYLESISNT